MNLFRKLSSAGGGAAIEKFGTFGGVFTSDVLTILGVITYSHLTEVVGGSTT